MKIRRAGAYRTRHMQAWTVTDVLGRVLVNAGTHEEIKDGIAPAVIEMELQEVKPKEVDLTDDEIALLRSKAGTRGIHVDMRWGVKRLQDEIAKSDVTSSKRYSE